MSLRVLVVAAAIHIEHDPAFGDDRPLPPSVLARITAAREMLFDTRQDLLGEAYLGPSTACRETAAALGMAGRVEPALADVDYGRWTGRSLATIAQADPTGLDAWLTDPAAAPHGGESLAAVSRRVGHWLDTRAEHGGRIVVLAPAMVVRAAVAHAVGGGGAGISHLDVEPLACARLTCIAGTWRVRLVSDLVRGSGSVD